MEAWQYLREIVSFMGSGLLVDTFLSMSWFQRVDVAMSVFYVAASLWCIAQYPSKWTKVLLIICGLVFVLEFLVDFHFYGHIYQYGYEPAYDWIGLTSLASLIATPIIVFLLCRWSVLNWRKNNELRITLIEKEDQV